MAVCDTCIKPGACCHDIPLMMHPGWTKLEMMIFLATYWPDENRETLPFHSPRLIKQDYTPEYDMWVVDCMNILPDGRCGDYENRPYGPCVVYEPGECRLCVHHVKDIGLCPDLKEPTMQFLEYEKCRQTLNPEEPIMDDPTLQFFSFSHLPAHLREVSEPFGDLALQIAISLPDNPERTVALRKLLEAKDAAVRARLFK